MAYKVRITPLAIQDIEQATDYYLQQASPTVSSRWLDGLQVAVSGLGRYPLASSLAPENDDLDFEARQVLYQSHRVVFTVEGDEVYVLRVNHQARRPLTSQSFSER